MLFNRIFLQFFLLIINSGIQEKEYVKNFYPNSDKIKSEGWVIKSELIGYWKYYHPNGQIESEGHFKKGLKTKYWYFYQPNGLKIKEGHYKDGKQHMWWLFYDNDGVINHKCQLKDNQKNGYCLIYQKEKLIKASKFKNGKKIKEWTNLRSFKKENKLSDLQ